MEFKIVPTSNSNYPIKGLLIKGERLSRWLFAIQELKLPLNGIQVYPIPNMIPNSVWGCFVLFKNLDFATNTGRHELVQQVSKTLYLAERADISPQMTMAELDRLFASGLHIMHPHFGLVELPQAIDFSLYLNKPALVNISSTLPKAGITIPHRIQSFQVQPMSPEEVLKNMAENFFPKREEMKDKPLSVWEKTKLFVFRQLFNMATPGKPAPDSRLKFFLKKIYKNEGRWKSLQESYENLEDRNKKQLDKLLDLLKKNPEEALKYAIPLDEGNTSRGGLDTQGWFELYLRWFNFSLFSEQRSRGTSGKSIDLGNDYLTLHQQYNKTAEELVKQKEYEKAAFVYMKLLKQYSTAADTLELGNRYQEAATVHLKHTGNKLKAAQCYEKGNMTQEAISLFKELGQHEKVGDLFMTLNNRSAALEHYGKVVEQLKSQQQYVKASLVCRDKMSDLPEGQALLMEGWTNKHDAVNCLNLYFSNIPDQEKLRQSITDIYKTQVSSSNMEAFLQVIQFEFKRNQDHQEMLREMAFEIVANKSRQNPGIVVELKHFNPRNKELLKDVLRFKLRNKG